ncbi:hypothetical protein TNCV_4438401 [Trichonephila clavipes]|nr:hypothetical protein TNCV_4438401 [Trichonephila clavipes]
MLCSISGYQNLLWKNMEVETLLLDLEQCGNFDLVLKNPVKHEIFFDNFFSSDKLLTELSEKNFKATDTIRDNRTRRCPLKSPEEAKKMAKR